MWRSSRVTPACSGQRAAVAPCCAGVVGREGAGAGGAHAAPHASYALVCKLLPANCFLHLLAGNGDGAVAHVLEVSDVGLRALKITIFHS